MLKALPSSLPFVCRLLWLHVLHTAEDVSGVRKRAIAWARRVWDKVILAPLRAGELVEIRQCLTTAPLDTNMTPTYANKGEYPR